MSYLDLDLPSIGAFNAAYYGASALGTVVNWWLPDRIGRLRSIQIAWAISTVGAVLQTATVNYAMFIVGRTVGGFGIGMLFALCPVYASEISSPHFRGRVGALYSLNTSFSFMITTWLGLVSWLD